MPALCDEKHYFSSEPQELCYRTPLLVLVAAIGVNSQTQQSKSGCRFPEAIPLVTNSGTILKYLASCSKNGCSRLLILLLYATRIVSGGDGSLQKSNNVCRNFAKGPSGVSGTIESADAPNTSAAMSTSTCSLGCRKAGCFSPQLNACTDKHPLGALFETPAVVKASQFRCIDASAHPRHFGSSISVKSTLAAPRTAAVSPGRAVPQPSSSTHLSLTIEGLASRK